MRFVRRAPLLIIIMIGYIILYIRRKKYFFQPITILLPALKIEKKFSKFVFAVSVQNHKDITESDNNM